MGNLSRGFIVLAFLFGGAAAYGDKYQSFAELVASEEEGVDFRIEWENRQSCVAVFAIHGGKIERGTSELTRAIAGRELSYYLFDGDKGDRSWDLHVTSHRFDEPNAFSLAKTTQSCLSLHGYRSTQSEICIGGQDVSLGLQYATEFRQMGYQVEFPCRRLPGRHPENIVNRCKEKGVQLELSETLRDELLRKPEAMASLAEGVRQVVESQCDPNAI